MRTRVAGNAAFGTASILATLACDPVSTKPVRPPEEAGAPEVGDPRWANWPIPPDSPPDSQYVTEGGVVHDTVTNLDWTQQASAPMIYSEADSYCAHLTLGGLSWRLPTRIELISILDLQPKAAEQVFVTAFVQNRDFYVSSSALAYDANQHWGVSFGAKTLDTEDPAAVVFYSQDAQRSSARCVHDGRGTVPGVGRRPSYEIMSGYAIDSRTGLAVEMPVPQPSAKSNVSQGDAAATCERLSLGPWDNGWRLPTAKELYAIIDETRSYPALDSQLSASKAVGSVWSSPTHRRVDLSEGGAYLPGDPISGWCVHSP